VTLWQARIITSGAGDWRYLDVVHTLAGKLEALEWVRQVYNVPVAVSEGDKQPAWAWRPTKDTAMFAAHLHVTLLMSVL